MNYFTVSFEQGCIVEDIKKLFLQIGLNENQKYVTKLFWLKHEQSECKQ